MRRFRISLGLVLLALAGLAAWAAREPGEDGLIAWLALWAAAVLLAWKALAAFMGRIKPSRTDPSPQSDMPRTPTAPPRPQDDSPDVLSSTVSPDRERSGTGTPPPAERIGYREVMQEAGNVIKTTTVFTARVVVVLILCLLVPIALIIFFVGMASLLRGDVLQAAPPLLAAGFLGWYCWGPLRGHWNGDDDEEPQTDDAVEQQTNRAETAPPGGAVAVSAPRMSLPEEFLLLSYTRHGNIHDHARSVAGCAAAELGELALRRRIRVAPRHKINLFGLQCYISSGKIHVLDLTPTGLAWADDLLAELGRLATPKDRTTSAPAPSRPIALHKWLRRRDDRAFLLHREAMIERNLLYRPGSPSEDEERHYPDIAVRNLLIDRLQAVTSGKAPMDEHTLFLLDLVGEAGLNDQLGLTLSIRQRLDYARGVGAVAAVPEDMRDTSTLLSGSIFTRTLGRTSPGGDGDPGDGGE